LTDITPQLVVWIQHLRALAQTGLAFTPSMYDSERYEEILKLASKMAASLNDSATLDLEFANALASRWRADIVSGVPGYVTPKVGVGAVVFNEREELLMVHRTEGNWFIPTGWADVGYTPAEVAAKEVREETGMLVTPLRVVGIYDVARWWNKNANPYFYSIMFYCRLDGGALKAHPVETRGAGFFPLDALPHPTFPRHPNWIDHALAMHRGQPADTFFDQV
jgi:ADP-ribose pyrophosphatase YjhB (NUDIX family)